MNGSICETRGTEASHATVTLERRNITVVIKNAPAQVCTNCGEYYLSDEIAERVMKVVEEAASRGVQVEVANYAA